MKTKQLILCICLLCTFFMPTHADSQSPELESKALKGLLDSLAENNYKAFLKPGTQTFKSAISQSMFNSVYNQVGTNLSKGYSYIYFGFLNHSGIKEHIYKIKYKGVNDDTLARITMLEGKVAGFLLQ